MDIQLMAQLTTDRLITELMPRQSWRPQPTQQSMEHNTEPIIIKNLRQQFQSSIDESTQRLEKLFVKLLLRVAIIKQLSRDEKDLSVPFWKKN